MLRDRLRRVPGAWAGKRDWLKASPRVGLELAVLGRLARGPGLGILVGATWACGYILVCVPLAEKALIAQIRRLAKSRRLGTNRSVVAGIGDDCAVLRVPAGHEMLVTTDFSIEGVHFQRGWHRADSVGHRCLTRGLSDIAAMGGEPLAAFLSLALPRKLPQAWTDGFLKGLLALAGKYRVTLAGGDTAESPTGVLADIVVVGSVPRGLAILRSGARPGDRIFVSGKLGGSAAALKALEARPRKVNPKDYARHFYPKPRIDVGRILREKRLVSAMIDTSDGLSTDLTHICEESGVGAKLEAAAIPRAKVGKPPRQVDLDLALHGGEDYELLFTVRAGKRVPSRIAGVALTQIGTITRQTKIFLVDHRLGKRKGVSRELLPQGWEHFRR